jgi:hypothetical protein
LPRTVRAIAFAIAKHGVRRLSDPGGGFAGFKLFAHFDSMTAELLKRRQTSHGMTVLDQGPIYNYVWSKRLARHGVIHDWVPAAIGACFEKRAKLLSAVVLLDTPDAVLLDRIAGRAQEHEIKGADSETSAAFIAEYRDLYAGVIDELRSWTGIEPLIISTCTDGSEEVGRKIADALSIPKQAANQTESARPGGSVE